jgi:hypothetical protein
MRIMGLSLLQIILWGGFWWLIVYYSFWWSLIIVIVIPASILMYEFTCKIGLKQRRNRELREYFSG